MQPGCELDALVAEKVMGFQTMWFSSHQSAWFTEDGGDIPKYSTDIAAAWEVVEKIDLLSRYQLAGGPGTWVMIYYYNNDEWDEIKGETAPHVICLAALKAVGALPT